MPIRDIQTKKQGLTRLGIIRLGTSEKMVKNGREFKKPKEADHFVVHDAPVVRAAYGDKPDRLLIYLPMPDVDGNLIAYHELWGGGYCQCRGDGERVIDMLTPDGIQVAVRDSRVELNEFGIESRVHRRGDTIPCPGLEHTYSRCARCKPSGTLMMMVRDPSDKLQLVGGEMGYYQLHTNSYHNIRNLTAQLQYAEGLARQMGSRSLQGIPMILKRVKRPVSYIAEKQETKEKYRTTVDKWFVDLEFDLDWVRRANIRLNALAMGEITPMLPSGVEEVEGQIVDGDE